MGFPVTILAAALLTSAPAAVKGAPMPGTEASAPATATPLDTDGKRNGPASQPENAYAYAPAATATPLDTDGKRNGPASQPKNAYAYALAATANHQHAYTNIWQFRQAAQPSQPVSAPTQTNPASTSPPVNPASTQPSSASLPADQTSNSPKQGPKIGPAAQGPESVPDSQPSPQTQQASQSTAQQASQPAAQEAAQPAAQASQRASTPNHADLTNLPEHPPAAPKKPTAKQRRQQLNARTKAYLGRRVDVIPGHVEHGVLATRMIVGYPHIYRLELALGVLDHLTIGATAHWIVGQKRPGISPVIHAAFFRGRRFVVGANYRQLLYPPPVSEERYAEAVAANRLDPSVPVPVRFQRRVHYLMAALSFSQAWFSASLELGWARGREFEPYPAMPVVVEEQYTIADRIAGGIGMRFGTRRYGLTIGARYPYPSFDLGLDLRFGLFEVRRRGTWLRPE